MMGKTVIKGERVGSCCREKPAFEIKSVTGDSQPQEARWGVGRGGASWKDGAENAKAQSWCTFK